MAVPSDKYFPATVSCQVHKIGSLTKDKLTKEQLQMFDKTIFGLLLNVNMVLNVQLIHHFLLRVTLEKNCDNKRLQNLLFGSANKKIITCLELEEIFKNFEFTNDKDAVKVALALFIETVMVGKDKKTQFDMDILGKVDDEEVFKNFDWSTFFYTCLLNSLKTILQGKKEAYELKRAKKFQSRGILQHKRLRTCFSVNQTPQLSPRKKNKQTVADEFEMHPMTKKKSHRSNDKEQQSHSKSYKALKKNIKEVHKDESALTSIVCRMDDTIRKEHQEESGSDISIDGKDADLILTIRDISDNLNAQSQKEEYLPEMITTLSLVSQPLPLCEILPSSSNTFNQPAMASLDQTVQIHEVPPSISIVNEESQLVEIQKNNEAVTLVENEPAMRKKVLQLEPMSETNEDRQQPMKRRKICKIANKKVPDQDQQVNPPTTSTNIISELTIPVPDVEIIDTMDLLLSPLQKKMSYIKKLCKINKPHCIVWQGLFDTHLLTTNNKKTDWKDTTTHLNLWAEEDLEYFFNTIVGDFQEKPRWGDVNYVIDCINIKEHWLVVAADMRKCKIYVFDLMSNYVDKKLVNQALEIPARYIASLAIAIGVNLHSKRFKYGPWPVLSMY
ncbi:Ulp1-like peptidase [Cucumis melo var. makuwa]|uniref:Ulp1-like peptidase n=1 Tax=Cucumis melo var. makuwa TaxID=1194695 RepID=A0A5A7VN69_CUCMM|nr:Ulp1-like peptidase [Cucumis melo var. makuwa]TYK26297.1 Ulp1-like peptidase [Cucumis melo var. makuwa]